MPFDETLITPDKPVVDMPNLAGAGEDAEGLRLAMVHLERMLKQAESDRDRLRRASSEYRLERNLFRSVCRHVVDLTASTDSNQMLTEALSAIHQMTEADATCIVVKDRDGDSPRIHSKGVDPHEEDLLLEQLSSGVIADVFRTGNAVYSKNAIEDAQLYGYASVHRLHLRTVFCVPISRGDGHSPQVVGALYLDRRQEKQEGFTEQAREAISLVARYLGLWLDRWSGQGTGVDPTLPYRSRGQFREILGASPALADLLGEMDRIVRKGVTETALITGESGTGKELIAQCLHRYGPKSHGPFVAVNCASLPDNLVESELFGSVKGGYTGAVDRKGRIASADRGTCFLDEVGELSPGAQAKLLRFLQDKTVQPVGSDRGQLVNVWIIAATNRDLEEEVKAGRFRLDLLHRLNVMRLRAPSLRDRPEDIPGLARAFLQREQEKPYVSAKLFTPDALDALQAHPWPGNIRELENAIKQAAVRVESSYITSQDLALGRPQPRPRAQAPDTTWKGVNYAFRRRFLEQALAEHGPNVAEVAKKLGLNRTHLYKLLDGHDIQAPGDAPRSRSPRSP